MRKVTWVAVALAVWMGVRAMAGDEPVERPNAAEVYAAAVEALPEDAPSRAASALMIYCGRSSPAPIGDAERTLARELEPALREVLRATAMERFEPRTVRTSPFDPTPEHLRDAHNLGVTMSFSTAFAFEIGEEERAAEIIVAQLRYARRLGSDGSLMGSLLSAQQAYAAHTSTRDGLKLGLLSERSRRQIGEEMSKFPAEDPFGGRAALQREGELMVSWLERGAPGLRTGLPKPLQDAEAAEAFEREAEHARRYFAEALRAWDAEGDEAGEALDRRLKAGEFGVVVGVTTPGWAAARRQFRQCGAWMDELSARLMEGLD